MRKASLGSRTLTLLFIAMVVPCAARAQTAARTWVSGDGDDVNTCGRLTPCKTFARAILQTATGGEINAVSPGGFGVLVVTKSITVDGAGSHAASIASGTTGIQINITAASDTAKTVRLRNLSINGTGSGITGIRMLAARRLFVEHVVIDGFDDHGILIEPSQARVFISNTTIRTIGKSGIHVAPAVSASSLASVFIERSTIVGAFHGLKVQAGSRVVIRDSSLTHNRQGFLVEKGELTAVNCVLTEHLIAVNSVNKAIVRLSLVTVVNNDEGLKSTQGGQIISFKNNVVHGNGSDGAPTSVIEP